MKANVYLEDLFVLPEYWRRGDCDGFAQVSRATAVGGWNRAYWIWNEEAIAFYKRIGAVLMDDWTGCRVSGEALVSLSKQSRVRLIGIDQQS